MSSYSQKSFIGGMNLIAEDMRIKPNEYRVGYNLRNRFDVLQAVKSSVEDMACPAGIKQEMVTFGNYVILFVAGRAYYRLYSATGWRQIAGFQMSDTAARFWTCPIPVATTNYLRYAGESTIDSVSVADASQPVKLGAYSGTFNGDVSGLLVQDNLNQPMFLYVNPSTGLPVARTTQKYTQWTITDGAGRDRREYVPVGNSMAWVDGVLYIVSQDFNYIYRSVSGRPLDFVVNIDKDGEKGGDATTTSYSVGIGGIQCIRAMSNDALFVAAGNSNFSVSKNLAQNAPKVFGEFTFIRTFLFNATCLSDRSIFDSLGDTRFVSLSGVRSFNAILQQQNEGRNSPFSLGIQSVLETDNYSLVQSQQYSAGILFNEYELYAIQTVMCPVIAVYDTLNKCWSSFDVSQTGGKRIKQLAKIELSIQRLFAITEDDRLFTLYSSDDYDTPKLRPITVSPDSLKKDGYDIPSNSEHKVKRVEVYVTQITEDMTMSVLPYVNNRLTKQETMTKEITYSAPSPFVSADPLDLPDVNTQSEHIVFPLLSTGQGFGTFVVISWTGGCTLTSFDITADDIIPDNPSMSRGTVK